jgi:hypothetical protein
VRLRLHARTDGRKEGVWQPFTLKGPVVLVPGTIPLSHDSSTHRALRGGSDAGGDFVAHGVNRLLSARRHTLGIIFSLVKP